MKGIKNLSQLATLSGVHQKDGRKVIPADLNIIENATIVFDDKSIKWVGKANELPDIYQNVSFFNGQGHCLTPEIVDSHTHLVFAGNRANEYCLRLNGADYEEIANAGGGILATVTPTREISEEDLFQIGIERINRIYNYGVGTIEIKSGYALDFENELKLTNVINRLKKHFSPKIQIFNTYMAAHAIPKEYSSGKDYIEKVVIPLLEQVKEDIDCVDIFHEVGYFDEKDVENLFEYCSKLKIHTKIHADEFNDNNGASLAAKYKSLSADHLLKTSKKGADDLAKAQTVATLLPGTSLFLGKNPADAKTLINAGAKVALASDYNPGSCHCDNLLLIASMAAPMYQLNQAELWSAICYNAAHALSLKNQGVIQEGFAPRFSVFKCNSISEITYHWGRNFNVTKDFK